MGSPIKGRRQLLASALRTATTTSAQFKDIFFTKMRMYLNVTAASGTGGLQPQVQGVDPVSGLAVSITTGGTAITATGTYVYEIGLAEATAAGNVKECDSRPLPTLWQLQVVHGDSSDYTYSVGADMIP